MTTSPSAQRKTMLVALSCVLLLVTACGSGRSAESEAVIPQSPGDLDGTSWLLVATGDTDAVPQSTPLTLGIDGDEASGNGPCNRFRMSFVVDGDDLTTGKVAATKRACPEPQRAAEARFFGMLEAADGIEKLGDQLVLTGPDDLRLVFDPAEEPADQLAGTWDIVNIATADALTTPVPGTEPTLTFDADGTLAVDTGCNIGSTTWTAEGSTLAIDPMRTTLKACPEPPGAEAQQSAIFDAVDRTKTVELSDRAVDHDTAVLLDSEGTTTLVLARSP